MNRKIVVAVIVITGSGVVNAILNKKALTPVIIGSYVFLFVLSIADMYGGPMSTLAGALAMLAVTYVLITEVPWTTIINLVQGKNAAIVGTTTGATRALNNPASVPLRIPPLP